MEGLGVVGILLLHLLAIAGVLVSGQGFNSSGQGKVYVVWKGWGGGRRGYCEVTEAWRARRTGGVDP